jgi:hypothetical protein
LRSCIGAIAAADRPRHTVSPHELRGPARVVVGIGAASGDLLTYRTSMALAEQLGTPPVEFAGDHGGFIGQPVEFAAALRKVLSSRPAPQSAV